MMQPANYADFRCGLDAGFFAVVSLAAFLPEIGISISFWPAAALRGFLADFCGALSAAAPPALRRSASIRSTTLPAARRSFGVIGLPARFWLMRSTRAVSYWSSNLSVSNRRYFWFTICLSRSSIVLGDFDVLDLVKILL